MEYTTGDRHRLYVIVLAYAVRSLFAQAPAHAFNVCKDQGFTAAAAHDRVEDHGLEEG